MFQQIPSSCCLKLRMCVLRDEANVGDDLDAGATQGMEKPKAENTTNSI